MRGAEGGQQLALTNLAVRTGVAASGHLSPSCSSISTLSRVRSQMLTLGSTSRMERFALNFDTLRQVLQFGVEELVEQRLRRAGLVLLVVQVDALILVVVAILLHSSSRSFATHPNSISLRLGVGGIQSRRDSWPAPTTARRRSRAYPFAENLGRSFGGGHWQVPLAGDETRAPASPRSSARGENGVTLVASTFR